MIEKTWFTFYIATKREGYDFNIEIASEDFIKIKEKVLAIGGLALSELKPQLKDEITYGTNYNIKGWGILELKIPDNIVQG